MTQTINTPATAEEVFEQAIKPLSPAERLKLATLILNSIPPEAVIDYSTEWSDADYQDFSNASFALIEQHLDEEENANGATR